MHTLLRALLFSLAALSSLSAQQSPFVRPDVFEALSGEISGDISFDHIRHLTLYHSPSGASQGFRDKLRWIAKRAREVGLEEVRIIDNLRYSGVGWTPRSAELFILSPQYRRLASYAEFAVAIADYSGSGSWEGELVDVGSGMSVADYAGKDIKGKIVLTSGAPSAVMKEAVWDRGALGVVYYNTVRGMDRPDQIAWVQLSSEPPKGKENTFAFSVSYRAGMELKQRLAERFKPHAITGRPTEEKEAREKIILRARVEAHFEKKPKQWIVEGYIRGTTRNSQQIVLTAHGQEEKFSANDDNSGCANLLEIARSLQKLIREGRLKSPARDIRFWWVNEIMAEYEYFSEHPKEARKMLVNINQDMVGAKQSAGSRIQHITRTPHSRPSFLNEVMESITGLVGQGNSAYLSAAQAGTRQPYSKPILARMGTRERYGYEIVPYFSNTDHMVFNDASVGVPAVTLTNWPDDYIHSSDDDLWQVDATQLQRNAFVVASVAWYFATLDAPGAPVLAANVASGARRAMHSALHRATQMLALARPEDRAEACLDGVNLLDETLLVSSATVDSVRAFRSDAAFIAALEGVKKSLAGQASSLKETLGDNYRLLTGQAQLPAPHVSEKEKQMAAKVPQVAGRGSDYIEKRGKSNVAGMHGVMQYEAWNFVDGRRSYLDIYHAVRAEAQSAGDWYYGKVTANQVWDLLEAGVKAGILRLEK